MFIEKEAIDGGVWTMPNYPTKSSRVFIERFKAIISNIIVSDKASLAALKNALWQEVRFRDVLPLNKPVTIEDALHYASRFIIMEEENAALAKKIRLD